MKTLMRTNGVLFAALVAAPLLVPAVAMADGPMPASHRKRTVTEDNCTRSAEHPYACMSKRVKGWIQDDGSVTPYPKGGGGGGGSTGPNGGYAPTDLLSAYNLPASSSGMGAGKTVALVEAYHYANAEADMQAYRTQYGLPACPSFQEIGSSGGSASSIKSNSGWEGEEMLDIEMVSAICPSCNILVIEATNDSGNGLFDAANEAATEGVNIASNSWGGDESQTMESNYNHPGTMYTASAGDGAFGASYPATSAYVLAVGGTNLAKSTGTSRGWTETVWSYSDSSQGPEGTGSGCSAEIPTPSWQNNIPAGCSMRMEADVSADADPDTGVAVYDSGGGGWEVVGGTSAASPIVASVLALYGLDTLGNSMPYTHTNAWYDVTSGSNDPGGGVCTVDFECNAEVGYDGPTGWGTPNGTILSTILSGTSSGSSSGGTSSGSSSGAASSSGGTASGSSSGGTDNDAGVAASSSGGGGASGSSSGSAFGGSSGGSFYGGEDAGTPTVDAGNVFAQGGDAGESFPLSGSSSAGCGCTTPGSSMPLQSGGAFGLMLGVAALFGARRKR